jgi:hypothetical protein
LDYRAELDRVENQRLEILEKEKQVRARLKELDPNYVDETPVDSGLENRSAALRTEVESTNLLMTMKAGESLKYWRMLRLKYQRAARYPWLSVAPDPPEPQTMPMPGMPEGTSTFQ